MGLWSERKCGMWSHFDLRWEGLQNIKLIFERRDWGEIILRNEAKGTVGSATIGREGQGGRGGGPVEGRAELLEGCVPSIRGGCGRGHRLRGGAGIFYRFPERT